VHLRRLRLVLDELEDLGAQDDRARRDGEVAPDLEALGVHARRQPWRPGDVAREPPRAARQVGAALVDDRTQDRRVGPREVRGRERVEHIARGEARLALGLPVGVRVGDDAVDGLADRLEHAAQEPVALPRRVGEAAVALAGRCSERPAATRASSAPSPVARAARRRGWRATPAATCATARGWMKRRVPLPTAASVSSTSRPARAPATGPVLVSVVVVAMVRSRRSGPG
jgi:hypothetical protein